MFWQKIFVELFLEYKVAEVKYGSRQAARIEKLALAVAAALFIAS